MDRARWGRLSGDGTSWTLLAASVLAEQRPGRGRAGVVIVPMPAGRGHGQHDAQEWARMNGCDYRIWRRRAQGSAECDTCERSRQLE